MTRRRQPRNNLTFRTVEPGEDVPLTARATNGVVLRFHSAKLHPLIAGAIVATYRA